MNIEIRVPSSFTISPSIAKSWKTTVTSWISAGGSFVLFATQLNLLVFPKWILVLAMFAAVGGLAQFGISAKDADMTGGQRGQPSSPSALADANQAAAVAK